MLVVTVVSSRVAGGVTAGAVVTEESTGWTAGAAGVIGGVGLATVSAGFTAGWFAAAGGIVEVGAGARRGVGKSIGVTATTIAVRRSAIKSFLSIYGTGS